MARDPGITPQERVQYGITDEILHELLAGCNFIMDGDIIRHVEIPESDKKLPLEVVTSQSYWEFMEENNLSDMDCDEVLLAVGVFAIDENGEIYCTGKELSRLA